MSQTRRSFLSKASAAPIIYQLVGAAPQLRAAGANDQIGVGFIGAGAQGTNLLNWFRAIEGVRPVIASDLYTSRLDRAKELTEGAIETTGNYQDVLARKDIDAVVIATPDHSHHRMVLDALAADKHVYIEKPLTWDIKQGADIIKASNKSPRLLQVGSHAKSSKLTAKAREIVKSGALGKVNMVRMSDNRNTAGGAWVYPIPPNASPETIDWQKFLGPAPKRPFSPEVFFRWRCWWEYSGGVATDLFVHLLTELHEVMDVEAPKSVVSSGGLYRWNDGRNVPDVMNSIFEYGEGFVADLYVNLDCSRRPHPTTIMGTEGSLVWEGRGRLALYPEPEDRGVETYSTRSWPQAMQDEYFASFTEEQRRRAPRPAAKEIEVERGPSHVEQFIRSLRGGTASVETAEEGHYAAGGAHLANMAYRKRQRMSWDIRTNKVSRG